MSIEIEANFLSYIVCGIALAFSIIVPGMSFSTLLMPLGLYTPFVQGIGDFDLMVLIPAGIGVGVTFIAFARFISNLFNKHYSVAQNIVVGIVIAATAVIIPFNSFSASVLSAVINVICIAVGVAFARLISKLNKRYDGKKSMPEQNG
jgi:putative membrane protein